MTLYLKYRSKTINELDLKKVRESLKKILLSASVPHAFLFAGPKGTGKTSAARILAKVVNCESDSKKLRGSEKLEPCNECKQCLSISKGDNLDVIELDAASHRGIDDVRHLRDAVKLAPAAAKKKVYIIDEAHMLTTEASNALLKTLEEPPDHVIFILATTNPEKLIDTIRSRVTTINFSKADTSELVRALKRVAKGEKIKADEELLKIIAKHSDGSFRDAIKILEKVIVEKVKLNRGELEKFLGASQDFNISEFFEILSEKDSKAALQMIEKSANSGASAKDLNKLVLEKLQKAMLKDAGLDGDELGFNRTELVQLIELFDEASERTNFSLIEHLPMELAVVKWCSGKGELLKGQENGDSKVLNSSSTKQKQPITKKSNPENEGSSGNGHFQATDLSSNGQKTNGADGGSNGQVEDVWGELLHKIRDINASTEALLRASKPLSYEGGMLTLGVFYKFHKERLESNPHRDILEDVLGRLLENKVRILCKLTQPPIRKTEETIEVRKVDPAQNKEHSNGKDESSATVLTETDDTDIINIAKEIFET